ncbi:MAG: ADP-ribosylglycohydrolase family protein [Pirellulales bacterium]|nr:ADP-ribosylglycohydrolase family protein [Pirellulales bacterium]
MNPFRRGLTAFPVILALGGVVNLAWAAEYRTLPRSEYRDKMAAGWIGQMAGVGWGAPTEFKALGEKFPEDQIPPWKPGTINQFEQDDIYVEMTFLRTLEQYGWNVSIRQAGIDFANSRYMLWHANDAGRRNLRAGVAPPDSGHPQFNHHADDIDYQIEADFSGLIAPGMPNVAIALGEKFGRLMNYGDGVYAGQFIGGMYAAAFFEKAPEKIVRAGLACIPEGSQYAEAVRDVLAWHRENPGDWKIAWKKVDEKYQRNPDYRRFSCDKGKFNIDAKLNGAFVVIGLLYGNRDPDATIRIATCCGQDSDCNPSSAAGVLFTTIGMKNLPQKFTSALDCKKVFSHTAYNFDRLVDVCDALAAQAVLRNGGKVLREAGAHDEFRILVEAPKPVKLEQSWAPVPPQNVRYQDEEMKQIKVKQDTVNKDE